MDDLSSDSAPYHFFNSTAPLLASALVLLSLEKTGSFSFVRGESMCYTEIKVDVS